MTTFLIVGDLHGNKPLIHYKKFDAIIAPGDFCSDKAREYMFAALKHNMTNPKNKKEWWEITGKKTAEWMIKKSMKDGRKILQWLNSFGKPVYIVPGNWDWTPNKESTWPYLKQDHYKKLIKGLPNIIDVYHKRLETEDYTIIGHGITSGPEYPQYPEDIKRKTKKELATMKKNYTSTLKKLGAFFTGKKPIIFISHNVPFNTPLDKIKMKSSPRYGYHYGSLIARTLIEQHQPLVCIGGHMHETHNQYVMGKTTAINAGFGAAVNTLLNIRNNNLTQLRFYLGIY
ncbi:MAG TPA: metallophosphoesterase [Candidatus Nanoarchaeia archaeon]|nr:metallophosphoesterase [Candidatus Nanoarchaeia archaeon]